jgi:3D (Asp-Asp-Asp) domain-containing protein
MASYCKSGTTASGVWTRAGIVASRSPIAFGTRIRFTPAIFGRSIYVVEDRMSASDRASFDVYSPICTVAIRWGIRSERVRIVRTATR